MQSADKCIGVSDRIAQAVRSTIQLECVCDRCCLCAPRLTQARWLHSACGSTILLYRFDATHTRITFACSCVEWARFGLLRGVRHAKNSNRNENIRINFLAMQMEWPNFIFIFPKMLRNVYSVPICVYASIGECWLEKSMREYASTSPKRLNHWTNRGDTAPTRPQFERLKPKTNADRNSVSW